MNESKLKIRSAGKDIALAMFTGYIGGIWVLRSLHKDVSAIEKELDIKSKPQLELFDAFLILVYGVLFIYPLAMVIIFSNVSPNYTSSSSSQSAIAVFFQQLSILLPCVIWIGARQIRRRILKIAEVENYGGGGITIIPIGFSWVAVIFFGLALVIAPLVTLYRTIRMYNELAESYNEHI